MGSSSSVIDGTPNEDGTITIAKSLVEEHRNKFNELEALYKDIMDQRDSYKYGQTQLWSLTEENRYLKKENDQLHATNTTLMSSNTANANAVSRLQIQILAQQETIDELTKKINETEEKLTQETKKAAGAMKMLTNERKQTKDSKQALKKQCSEVKVQKQLLENQLTQLKKTKFLAIQTALEDLNKRADAISNKILKNVKSNNRENYNMKFNIIKDMNDRMIKDLTSVTFTTRFYQNHHDALLKLQNENDVWCVGTIKTINGITKECRKLVNDYNNTVPNNFLKSIADHTRDMDTLEKVNFSSEFAKEALIQEDVLRNLIKEREVLENILRVERSNPNNSQVRNDKPNNLEYVNNLTSEQHILVVRNMEEGTDGLDDVIKFEAFVRHRSGRKMFISNVERYGDVGKEPRPAKITLKTQEDLEDVLNSKNIFDGYGHIKVEKFKPKKRKPNKNVNVDNLNK